MTSTMPAVYLLSAVDVAPPDVMRELLDESLEVIKFTNVASYLASAPAERPSCTLVDRCMHTILPIDLRLLLGPRGPGIPLLFMTSCAVKRVSGVLSWQWNRVVFDANPSPTDDLVPAVRLALSIHRQRTDEKLADAMIRQRFASLSARERTVMAGVIQGFPNKAVAASLGLSEKTVKAHRHNVMQKMTANSLVHLVHMSIVLGLVQCGAPEILNELS